MVNMCSSIYFSELKPHFFGDFQYFLSFLKKTDDEISMKKGTIKIKSVLSFRDHTNWINSSLSGKIKF